MSLAAKMAVMLAVKLSASYCNHPRLHAATNTAIRSAPRDGATKKIAPFTRCQHRHVRMSAHTGDTLPHTFRRLLARRVGPSFRSVAEIEEVPLENPQGDQVLLKIAYAGVNGGCETFRCRGSSYTPFAANQKAEKFVLGAEASGTVVAVGEDVKCLKVGDAVTCSGSGGFAEFILTTAQSCFPVKEASAEAVVLTLSGLTAAVALKATGGPLKAGEHALVTAAGGATGHMGVQLALLAGCHVVAVCGSAAKAQRLRDLGASRIINYQEEDVGEVLRREYPEGIDVAYEGVGGPLRDAVLDNLSEHGRMLVVGYISEYPHVKPDDGEAQGSRCSRGLPPARELFWQRQTVKIGGRTIYGDVWSGASRQDIPAFRRELFDLYEDGRLKAWVDSRRFHGLEQVSDAIEYMLTGQAIGKVVVSF